MKNFSIKAKLILLFILIKVIPLLLLSYIAINGVLLLEKYFKKNTIEVFNTNKDIIRNTANKAIDDSIVMLNKKSQLSLERLSFHIANNVSQFLYERDNDILFLSKLPLNEKIINSFHQNKQKSILVHDEYTYNDKKQIWQPKKKISKKIKEQQKSSLKDNNREFHYTNPLTFKSKPIPIYKEIVLFDTKGQEILKVSSINKKKRDISKQKNTYIKAETYYKELTKLKKGEIYVSQVIGEYRPSKLIGTFSKAKAQKNNIEFKPQEHAYAGVENPVGKKFDGIVRFITPYYKNNKKVGYLSMALDHRHIMEFTDTINPVESNMKQNIANAAVGNYAFMWDFEGKNISHPRDYFIYGYNANTGKRVIPWLSSDIIEKFHESKQKDLDTYLKKYPTFENQNLAKNPNIEQLKKDGNISLDCRYLNFAPQCTGWMEMTKDGGYGSFVIYWSNVWKLTTAATIPYYTGQYKHSKRGFGFVTIGANVDEFHKAAIQTKDNVNEILRKQTKNMEKNLDASTFNIEHYIKNIINELSISTAIMIIIVIVIAIFMSNLITARIKTMLTATQKFSNNEFNHKIKVTSNDEIGQLQTSFNDMTTKVSTLIKQQNDLNNSLEKRVQEAIKRTELDERTIREKDNILAQQSKMAAMGEMLENIAHQWRQPLSSISVASSGLKIKNKLKMLEENELSSTLDEITSSTQYLSTTIDDFRNFFKIDKPIETFNVEDTIEKTLNIIGSKFKNLRIQIVKDINPVQIRSYENELIQVLINLFNNSKDEFIEKNIKKRFIFIRLYKKDGFMILETKDNANGVKKEILDRIFEPYFTTKYKTQGTGIGLHMSREIITKHMKGSIEVINTTYEYENSNYTGANFIIKIPLKAQK